VLDNDHIVTDFMHHLERTFGQERAERCLDIFRQLRDELGYADTLGTLQHYRIAYLHDPHLLTVSNFFVDYPFANRLDPKSLDVQPPGPSSPSHRRGERWYGKNRRGRQEGSGERLINARLRVRWRLRIN